VKTTFLISNNVNRRMKCSPLDIMRGMGEMHRVVRPGGLVAFSTRAKEAFQPMRAMTRNRMERYGIHRPSSPPEVWMTLDDPEHLLTLLRKGGFRQGRVVKEPTAYALRDAEDWWTILWGVVDRGTLSQLSPESLEHFKRETLVEVGRLR
jgi:hypothetical protein